MAATVVSRKAVSAAPYQVGQIVLSGLTAGLSESVSVDGLIDTNLSPDNVFMTVTTPPTSNDPLFFSWTASSTSADTVTLKFNTIAGGSLTGAIVLVEVRTIAAAATGLNPPS